MTRTRVLILGAAGRDFHNFKVVYGDRAQYEVVSFTAQRIPHIAGRRYPPELAGALYPEGIPIFPEEEEPMQIPLEVSYRNVEPSEAIEKRVRSGLARLEKVCDRIVGCRVMVELPNRRRRTGNLYHVRIDVSIPGEDLVLKRNPPRHRAHEDAVQALGEAFDNARRKLVERRRRERFEVKAHEPVPEGRVAKLFAREGYGFIATGEGREVYFHRNSVLNGGFDRLDVGTRVRFAEEAGEEGPQASTVELVAHNGRKARHAAALGAP